MFTHLFYFTCLVRVIYEFYWIVTAKERIKSFKEFKAESKSLINTPMDMWPKEYTSKLIKKCLVIVLIAIPFFGIFSQQWFLISLFLVWDFLLLRPLAKFLGGIFMLCLRWLNSWITAAVFLFLIINHYHLHLSSQWQIQKLLTLIQSWL